MRFDKAQVRLDGEDGVFADGGHLVGREGRPGRIVEGFDVGPLELGHFDGELGVGRGVIGVCGEPRRQARAEVAESEGCGGAVGEVVAHDALKAARADDGLEAGEVLLKAGVEAEPVLAVVDFEALEGAEAVVGADDGFGFVLR